MKRFCPSFISKLLTSLRKLLSFRFIVTTVSVFLIFAFSSTFVSSVFKGIDFIGFGRKAFSASLTLDKIGALSTSGHRYSEWWYTGTAPILQGTAPAGLEVSVSVDDTTTKVTSNESGTWTYALTGLSSGDYKIVLSVEGDSYAFTLHLGQSLPASIGGSVSETSQSTVPDTGLAQVFAVSAGLVSLALGAFMFSKKKDSAFLD